MPNEPANEDAGNAMSRALETSNLVCEHCSDAQTALKSAWEETKSCRWI